MRPSAGWRFAERCQMKHKHQRKCSAISGLGIYFFRGAAIGMKTNGEPKRPQNVTCFLPCLSIFHRQYVTLATHNAPLERQTRTSTLRAALSLSRPLAYPTFSTQCPLFMFAPVLPVLQRGCSCRFPFCRVRVVRDSCVDRWCGPLGSCLVLISS